MCDQQSLRSACAYTQSDQSLCQSLEYSMIVKLLTKLHLEFLRLTGGCRGSSESTFVKMSNCWKSHSAAHFSCLHHQGRFKIHAFQIKSIISCRVCKSIGIIEKLGIKGRLIIECALTDSQRQLFAIFS